jgi:hypothetical protein
MPCSFQKRPRTFHVWVAPPDTSGQPFNPFATSTPVALPYQFSSFAENLVRWYSYFGLFGVRGNQVKEAGPICGQKI